MASLTERMIGAARLDVHTYEEVEADPSTIGQAMWVVVISSIAAGIGSRAGMIGLIVGSLTALAGWFVWAFVTYYLGTKLLPEPQTEADIGQLLRTTGFAASPGVLRVLGIVPVLGIIPVAIANIWMLASMVVAVRQALDYTSTLRAVGVCLIGWFGLVIISMVLSALTLGAI